MLKLVESCRCCQKMQMTTEAGRETSKRVVPANANPKFILRSSWISHIARRLAVHSSWATIHADHDPTRRTFYQINSTQSYSTHFNPICIHINCNIQPFYLRTGMQVPMALQELPPFAKATVYSMQRLQRSMALPHQLHKCHGSTLIGSPVTDSNPTILAMSN